MAGDTIVTIVGNLTDDPSLKFTPSGAAVASFTVASTPRTFDKQSQGWRDGETLFLRCSAWREMAENIAAWREMAENIAAWREMAENIAESLHEKGTRVIVQGRLVQRSYEKRTVIEMQADEVGPSLRNATAKVVRKSSGASQQWGAAGTDYSDVPPF